ncbi:MAG: SMC-Scp complex subunit ScpB [Gammaproteobacteria bacterium]|nr:SMC-Scp complex subunit ScpB [Gammaproteobacteria bacterium]
MTLNPEQFQRILEAAIMVAGRPLTLADLQKLFDEADQPTTKDIRAALEALQERYADHGIELRELASGYQFQARVELSPWLSRLWEERPPRYSRAVLETLALIAYRQPITRAEIEEIRGVTVSSHIVKTLQDREWIRIIGYRDVPGKPALYATTKSFLDHLNLKSLEELPALSDLQDMESQEEKLNVQLELAAAPMEAEGEAATNETTENLTDTLESEATTESDTEDQAATVETTDSETLLTAEDTESQLDSESPESISLSVETEDFSEMTFSDETEEQENFSDAEHEVHATETDDLSDLNESETHEDFSNIEHEAHSEESAMSEAETTSQAEQSSAELDELHKTTQPETHEENQLRHKEFSESEQ